MNVSDILRAAQGEILEEHFQYIIEISNGVPKLLEKSPTNGKEDIVINVVFTKQDEEFSRSKEYDEFFDECKRSPCGRF